MENIFGRELTWSCHICKEIRPDAKISVKSTTKKIPYHAKDILGMQTNVRYCNDNADCEEQAKTYSFLRKEGSNL